VVFLWHYLTCDRVAVYYGNCNNATPNANHSSCNKHPIFSRHYLDIYGANTPSNQAKHGTTYKNKPVVIFLTGGAWIIGYRMWGTLLARALAPTFGILVVVPDYRNCPQVTIDGMVQDVDLSIQWVFDHVEDYGGDRGKVVLVGQSAGAHIGGVVVAGKVLDWLRREQRSIKSSNNWSEEELVVEDAQTESGADIPPFKSTYSVQQLCGFISTSSPHNLVTMRPVFDRLGLSASLQRRIFGVQCDNQNDSLATDETVFEKWSPYHMVKKAHLEHMKLLELSEQAECGEVVALKDIFPKYCVIHGTLDKTVPVSEAIAFISLLRKLNIPTETKLYEGWSHTDPILEAPMRGNHAYHRDIYDLTCLWTEKSVNRENDFEAKQTMFDQKHPMLEPICPLVLVKFARFCIPF